MISTFNVLLRDLCLTQSHKNILLSSRSFVVLSFIFRAIIYLKLFFKKKKFEINSPFKSVLFSSRHLIMPQINSMAISNRISFPPLLQPLQPVVCFLSCGFAGSGHSI